MPLDQVLVIVIKATYNGIYVGIDSDRGSVWDASKSAYGTTISATSFVLGGSENGSFGGTERSTEARAKARYEATASKL